MKAESGVHDKVEASCRSQRARQKIDNIKTEKLVFNLLVSVDVKNY